MPRNVACSIVAILHLAPVFQVEAHPLKKQTIFSPVNGRVLIGGKPVARVDVVQLWSWFFVEDGIAQVKADAEGRFQFPEVSLRKLRKVDEVMITQDIELKHGGNTVTLWNLTRQDTQLNGELGGKPIELVAEL